MPCSEREYQDAERNKMNSTSHHGRYLPYLVGLWHALKRLFVFLAILFVIICVFGTLLFFVERKAGNALLCNWNDAFVWIFNKCLGESVYVEPLSIFGIIISYIIAVLRIFVFAIPAGLIAEAFSRTKEKYDRERQLDEFSKRLARFFKRTQCKRTLLRQVPIYKSVANIQAKMGMDLKDIIDTVERSPEFRIANLSNAEKRSEHPNDRLVVQTFPLTKDNCDYGCKIDRRSRVTIVSPTACNEIGIGHFSYYLALYGGFNYISREIMVDRDDSFSYYYVDKERDDKYVHKFISDINELSSGEGSWVIYVIAASGYPETIHFMDGPAHGCTNINDPLSTIQPADKDTYLSLVSNVHAACSGFTAYPMSVARQLYYGGKSDKYIARQISNKCSQFTLRVDYKVALWNDYSCDITKLLATQIHDGLIGGNYLITTCDEWKEKGYGFKENNFLEENN